MADSGRALYKAVRAEGRLADIRTGSGGKAGLEAAIQAAAEIFKANAGACAVVGSGRSSVEEQFLTRNLAADLKAQACLVSRVGKGDGILVSADRNPNVRGALVTGLIASLPNRNLTGLAEAIDAGRVKAVVSVGEDLAAAGLTKGQLAAISIVYLGTHRNETSDAAKVVIPTLSVFEKAGTFVNQQFRIQKFSPTVPGPQGAADDLAVLARLAEAAGARRGQTGELAAVWRELAAAVPALAAISYGNIPDSGLLLDGTPWAGLPFVEGEGLHFQRAP
jgi:NADH-quinone oxidoreductase subunit G